jgi:hypothetical protein
VVSPTDVLDRCAIYIELFMTKTHALVLSIPIPTPTPILLQHANL